jgi:hypothetical protein
MDRCQPVKRADGIAKHRGKEHIPSVPRPIRGASAMCGDWWTNMKLTEKASVGVPGRPIWWIWMKS